MISFAAYTRSHAMMVAPLAVTMIVLCIAPRTPGQTIRVYDLGSLPGGRDESHGRGVNRLGQVSGYSYGSESNLARAFFWDQTEGMVNIGTLEGAQYPHSDARGINDSGVVVGNSMSADGQRAFIWESGTGMQSLGTLGGMRFSSATAINSHGAVVGYSFDSGTAAAFLWTSEDGMIAIPRPLPNAVGTALAINDHGQVVGRAEDSSTDEFFETAFYWDQESGSVALGDLPGGHHASIAHSINSDGEICGQGFDESGFRAVYWTSDRTLINLGPGEARDINSLGTIVGRSTGGATVWNREGESYLLNDWLDEESQGWDLTFASAINDLGYITGTGMIGGKTHAFLAVPVPEPATLMGLLSSMSGLIVARMRRKELKHNRW